MIYLKHINAVLHIQSVYINIYLNTTIHRFLIYCIFKYIFLFVVRHQIPKVKGMNLANRDTSSLVPLVVILCPCGKSGESISYSEVTN